MFAHGTYSIFNVALSLTDNTLPFTIIVGAIMNPKSTEYYN